MSDGVAPKATDAGPLVLDVTISPRAPRQGHHEPSPALPEWNVPEARESSAFTLPSFSFWRTFDELFRDGWGRRMVSVEEFSADGTLAVRAPTPGIDPERDAEITFSSGMLHFVAERREEKE
jgi:HSP20 family molecular chaperone IbpA